MSFQSSYISELWQRKLLSDFHHKRLRSPQLTVMFPTADFYFENSLRRHILDFYVLCIKKNVKHFPKGNPRYRFFQRAFLIFVLYLHTVLDVFTIKWSFLIEQCRNWIVFRVTVTQQIPSYGKLSHRSSNLLNDSAPYRYLISISHSVKYIINIYISTTRDSAF